jgi:hypothetical protein
MILEEIIMSEEIEQKLLRQIEQLQKDIRELKGITIQEQNQIPTYAFGKITHTILKRLVMIEKNLDRKVFENWFGTVENIDSKISFRLKQLIDENESLIDTYNEEDLKVNFVIPVLNEIRFKSFEDGFRDFYELPIRYETDKFILNGTTDFVVSKGLVESKKPYFFIQEFKKGQTDGYPEPQLLAELISGVELNKQEEMKGAYIVGAFWYFVILKKLGKNKYE